MKEQNVVEIKSEWEPGDIHSFVIVWPLASQFPSWALSFLICKLRVLHDYMTFKLSIDSNALGCG